MLAVLLLSLLLLPLVEIGVFIEVGRRIGLWPTLGLTVATAIGGSLLLRQQGLSALLRAQRAVQRGDPPVAELLEGACVLVGGILLLLPGFVTDVAGVLLLVPPSRRLLLALLVRRLARRARARGRGRPDVIDGEFREVRPPPEPGDDEPPRLPPCG